MGTIFVFAPHNDDHALAMGGTIMEYRKRGHSVVTFVASFGELSHPHLKPIVIRKQRVKEAQRADRIYGGDGRVLFFGLREFHFKEDFHRKRLVRSLALHFKSLKPEKVFIPAPNDLHKDHKALSELMLTFLEKMEIKTEVYGYYVYPNYRFPPTMKLVIDVSSVYRKKLEALHVFSSQINLFSYVFTNNVLYIFTILKNGFTGLVRKTRFAETFYKLR